MGTLSLLNVLRELAPISRTLLIGSSEEYGIVGSGSLSEETVLRPEIFYAVSKTTQEEIGRLFCKALAMDTIMTRSVNHVGPRQTPSFVVADWCKQIAEIEAGRRKPIIRVGNLEVIRDFSHVADVANSYIDVLEHGVSGDVYNVGSGIGTPLSEVLETLLSLSTHEIAVGTESARLLPSDNPMVVCDRTKLDGLVSRTYRSLEETLSSTLDYWTQEI